jgi:hypothetical protein
MYSATYRRELDETVARESAHLWANDVVRAAESTTTTDNLPAKTKKRNGNGG